MGDMAAVCCSVSVAVRSSEGVRVRQCAVVCGSVLLWEIWLVCVATHHNTLSYPHPLTATHCNRDTATHAISPILV